MPDGSDARQGAAESRRRGTNYQHRRRELISSLTPGAWSPVRTPFQPHGPLSRTTWHQRHSSLKSRRSSCSVDTGVLVQTGA